MVGSSARRSGFAADELGRHALLALALAAATLAAGCATPRTSPTVDPVARQPETVRVQPPRPALATPAPELPVEPAPEPPAERWRVHEVGVASWYGAFHHGRRTASGAIFDMNRRTAAHRSLPFGTRVRVTNRRNNASTVVTINDRGPFIEGRIVDVSRRVAQLLEFETAGLTLVELAVEVAPTQPAPRDTAQQSRAAP